MELTLKFGDLTEDQLAELMLQKMEAAGKVLPAPERSEPYSVPEVAAAMGISVSTVRAEVKGARWPLVPYTGRILIPAWAVRVRQAGGKPMEEVKRLKKEGYLKPGLKENWE